MKFLVSYNTNISNKIKKNKNNNNKLNNYKRKKNKFNKKRITYYSNLKAKNKTHKKIIIDKKI